MSDGIASRSSRTNPRCGASSAGSTTQARRAWSPSDPAGTLKETTPGHRPAGAHPPVHRAGKGSRTPSPRGLVAL